VIPPAQRGTAARVTTTRGRWSRLSAEIRGYAELRYAWVLAIGMAALLVRLPLLFVEVELPPDSDTPGYLALASHIPDGSFAGVLRTPGYPVFLWLAGLAPGRIADNAVIAQHLIGVALAISIVTLGWRLFGRASAVIAGTLAAISPMLIGLEDVVLPDFLFAVAAFGGAGALGFAAVTGYENRRILVLAGASFAAAAYLKPVGQVLILAAPLAFLPFGGDLRRGARASAVVVATMLIAVSPWLARNAIGFGELGMSNQAGITLFNHAFELQGLPVPADQPQGPLVAELTATANATKGQRPSSYVPLHLQRRGWSHQDAIGIMRRLAVTAIRREPGGYIRTSFDRLGTAVDDLDAHPYPYSALGHRLNAVAWLPDKGSKAVLKAGELLTHVWFLLTAHTLLAVAMLFVPGPRRTAAAALLSVALLVWAATVLTHGGLWRYSVQVAPEVWIAGSAGLALVAGALRARLKTSPPVARGAN